MALHPINPCSVPYFHGRISREDSENILKRHGCREGLFLLRESMSTAGNYALSLCHHDRIHHYSIERMPDGMVMIQDGKKFIGPVELVQHHSSCLDGFLTRPVQPCNRPDGTSPICWPGVPMIEMEQRLLQMATQKGFKGNQLENVFGPQRQKNIAELAKDYHRNMGWFHGKIEREEADRIMTGSGHSDGKYLVRERDSKTFALSISFRNQTKHYKIEKHKSSSGEKLAIEDGPRFDSLMDMVAHYHNRADGLLCKLSEGCIRKGFVKPTAGLNFPLNACYGAFHGQPLAATPSPNPGVTPSRRGNMLPNAVLMTEWEEPPDMPQEPPPAPMATPRLPTGSSSGADRQKIYDSVPRNDDMFKLNKNDLVLQDKLGAGNFGSVMKGIFRLNGQDIPVAVKTLKQEELPNAESELMREAKLMASLQHRNIVRMIGVCRSEMIMLVLELAPLGPLNKYLKKKPDMSIKKVLEVMVQVAEGMAFLETCNFVHRDLAARNVLLVTEQFAKISDFGMSKALGLGNEYYRAESAGKWPLKWYAPECIYYFKFDSKSDVWSYGVTLWEATSYGAKPYKGMKGCQILDLIETGKRLDKPDACPDTVYDVMKRCWRHDKNLRPTFSEIVDLLRKTR